MDLERSSNGAVYANGATCGRCDFCRWTDSFEKDADDILRRSRKAVCMYKHMILEHPGALTMCSHFKDDDRKGAELKEYTVWFSAVASQHVDVEAVDAVDAVRRAREWLCEADWEHDEVRVTSIDGPDGPVKEKEKANEERT